MRRFTITDNPDICLLLERLALLHIDPDRLNAHDPLLFRELQGRCTLCRNKTACTLDLAMQPDPPASLRSWQSYCPNEGTLTDLAAHFEVDDLAKFIAYALHGAGLAPLSEKFKTDPDFERIKSALSAPALAARPAVPSRAASPRRT